MRFLSNAIRSTGTGMILFPAIDLKDGQCVRLVQGDMDRASVFNDDPAAQARAFAEAGCRWLHVVDLNGAGAGRPVNSGSVARILEAVSVPVQLGGGIRELATIEDWLEAGVARVVLGTAAARSPALVKAACRAFPGRIAVALDGRDGRIAVEGWAETSSLDEYELARMFEDAGVAAAIRTNIARDGTMEGPDIEATIALARAISIPVVASGGVGSLADLEALKQRGNGLLVGVIVGRAIYEGRVGVGEAVRLFAEAGE